MKRNLFLWLLLFNCLPAFTQSRPVIKNLVFEGAGIRGIAYCGAISALESENVMSSVEKVGGTSAGAITALAISLGYTGSEIHAIIGRTNYRRFNDGRFFFIGGINRLSKYFGWYRGRRFEDWLEKIIVAKTGNADITFEELHAKGFKDLYITGTCLNRQQLVVFSYETYPKMKVKDAVRISTSIPLYFEAVFIDKEGNVIKHPRNKENLDIMIDGGITGNFPIKIFDTLSRINYSTIGFRIDSDEQIKNDHDGKKQIAGMPVASLRQYMGAFYTMVIENLNRQQLADEDWQRTISISDGRIGPRIRKLSEEEISILVENGRQATQSYLN